MPVNIKRIYSTSALLLWICTSFASQGVNVVYPDWFKDSFYDLQSDLRDAREQGKQGIMVFVSMKTCSYCQAIIETAFQQVDIVRRLRTSYDVVGMNVFSDVEVVDTQGKSYWAKDFAVHAKATFTPTMLFYDIEGKLQLRLIGYQSPEKFRSVLDYLDGGYYTHMQLSDFMRQRKPVSTTTSRQTKVLNLARQRVNNRPLLVIVESAECSKCRQLRIMLKALVLQPYVKRLDIVYMSDINMASRMVTPDGKKLAGKDWIKQLGTMHTPAMIFFDEQGKEAVRIDTDILIDPYGKEIAANDAEILDNIRARFQYFLDKGYISLPQFQRWRARQAREKVNSGAGAGQSPQN